MDKKAISTQLKELACRAKRSKAAQLREVIDDVEAALAAGVSRADVLQVLSAQGLQMSMGTFETTLRRNRAARARNPVRAAKGLEKIATEIPLSLLEAKAESPNTTSRYQSATKAVSNQTLDEISGNIPDLDALSRLARKKK